MKNYPHPIIAREGWPFIFISLVVSAIVTWKWSWWSIPLWLITLFVVQFFRDPGRIVPGLQDAVLAPADGRIVVVEKARDVYADRDALKISVFMNVFNVHSNRSPVDGKVEKVTYFPGSFMNASFDKASTENERNAMIMTAETGRPSLVSRWQAWLPAVSSAMPKRAGCCQGANVMDSSVSVPVSMSICHWMPSPW